MDNSLAKSLVVDSVVPTNQKTQQNLYQNSFSHQQLGTNFYSETQHNFCHNLQRIISNCHNNKDSSTSYLVMSEYGSAETSWWNDNETTTAYIDFTKPPARKWYMDRLQKLIDNYGIDSFKFDAGESSWSPQVKESERKPTAGHLR